MLRGCARCYLGHPGWREDIVQSSMMSRAFDATLRAVMLQFKYSVFTSSALMSPDAAAIDETAELLQIAERSGDDFTVACARFVHGMVLTATDPGHVEGLTLLASAREAAIQERFTLPAAWLVDTHLAKEKVLTADLDGAIALLRGVIEDGFASGGSIYVARPTAILVEALLRRGEDGDLEEAQKAVNVLAAVLGEPGHAIDDLWFLRMRTMLARAHGDEDASRDYRDRYRKMATDLGFEGHMQWAEEMP